MQQESKGENGDLSSVNAEVLNSTQTKLTQAVKVH